MNLMKSQIQELVRVIVNNSHPLKIILFGSRAKGNFDKNSDIDVLVVKSHVGKKHSELIALKKELRPLRIPLDLLITDDREYGDRSKTPGTVYYWANKEGVVLYDSGQ